MGTTHPIDTLDIRGLPGDLQEVQLRSFLAQGGYLQMNPLGEKDYSLDAYIKGLGGSWFEEYVLPILTGPAGFLLRKVLFSTHDLCPNEMENLEARDMAEAMRIAAKNPAHSEMVRKILYGAAIRLDQGDEDLFDQTRKWIIKNPPRK